MKSMRRGLVMAGLFLCSAASAEMSFQFVPKTKHKDAPQKVIITIEGDDGTVETITHFMMRKTPLPVVDGVPPSPWRYAPIIARARPDKSSWKVMVPSRPRVRPIMRMAASVPPKNELLFLQLDAGVLVIRMRDDLAPQTVAKMKQWVSQGAFDGVAFARVVRGLMAQTTPPTNSDESLQAELSPVPYLRGTVGMMRDANDVNSADGSFFITFAPTSFLSGQYSAWGDVVRGMDLLTHIKRGHPQTGWVDDAPTIIRRAYLGRDMNQDEFATIMQPLPAMGGR